jgi:endonuclease/exonuclease/phosphatase family metal-dependent hydrolase
VRASSRVIVLVGLFVGCGGVTRVDAGLHGDDAGVRDAGADADGGSDAGTDVPYDAGMVEQDPDAAVIDEDDAGMMMMGVDAGSLPPPPTAVERTYRVLHWNIAGGKENDCEPALITRAVRRFVRDRDVDLVGLNEVCPAQHDAIRAALRELWGLRAAEDFAAFVGDSTGRVVGNAIYSRFGLQNVTREEVGMDEFGARNLLCGQVPELPHLRFCSTHLTPGDTAARAQLGRVRDRIETWWAERRDTVILSGDLNLHPNDMGLNAMYSPAADTGNNPDNRGHYRELDDDDPVHCRGYGERSLPGSSGGPCGHGGKIDFVFVRANRIVDGDYAGDTLDIPNDCTGVCSDHRAVVGRVRVRVRL